jgi:hypothetical protein
VHLARSTTHLRSSGAFQRPNAAERELGDVLRQAVDGGESPLKSGMKRRETALVITA